MGAETGGAHPRKAFGVEVGADLSILGAANHAVLRRAAAGRNIGRGSGAVSVAFGGEGTVRRGDAAAGAERGCVFPAGGVGAGSGADGGFRATGAAAECSVGLEPRGMPQAVRGTGGNGADDGGVDVWRGVAAVGAVAVAGEGRGHRAVAVGGAGREGGQGPADDGAALAGGAVEGASGAAARLACGGSRGGSAGRGAAGGVGAQVAEGGREVRVVLDVSVAESDDRSAERDRASPPRAGCDVPEGDPRGGGAGAVGQEGDAAHAAAQLRDAFAGGRNGHPRFAGPAGACGHFDDADLSAYGEADGGGNPESVGLAPPGGAVRRWRFVVGCRKGKGGGGRRN